MCRNLKHQNNKLSILKTFQTFGDGQYLKILRIHENVKNISYSTLTKDSDIDKFLEISFRITENTFIIPCVHSTDLISSEIQLAGDVDRVAINNF